MIFEAGDCRCKLLYEAEREKLRLQDVATDTGIYTFLQAECSSTDSAVFALRNFLQRCRGHKTSRHVRVSTVTNLNTLS